MVCNINDHMKKLVSNNIGLSSTVRATNTEAVFAFVDAVRPHRQCRFCRPYSFPLSPGLDSPRNVVDTVTVAIASAFIAGLNAASRYFCHKCQSGEARTSIKQADTGNPQDQLCWGHGMSASCAVISLEIGNSVYQGQS